MHKQEPVRVAEYILCMMDQVNAIEVDRFDRRVPLIDSVR